MFSAKSIPLSLLLFLLFLHAGKCDSPLCRSCFSQENFTASSNFGANLNEVFNLLDTKVPPTGFGVATVGQGGDKVNGLALCRGDVSSTNCESCVLEARKKLEDRCPRKKGAIVWYDYCLLKYSDEDFFGKIDDKNKFYLFNTIEEASPDTFNSKVNELLSRLSDEASQTPTLYATGKVRVNPGRYERRRRRPIEPPYYRTLYGLAQCTRDLSAPACKKCIDEAIGELQKCCDAKEGARAFGGSCSVRYELYPIVGGTNY